MVAVRLGFVNMSRPGPPLMNFLGGYKGTGHIYTLLSIIRKPRFDSQHDNPCNIINV